MNRKPKGRSALDISRERGKVQRGKESRRNSRGAEFKKIIEYQSSERGDPIHIFVLPYI